MPAVYLRPETHATLRELGAVADPPRALTDVAAACIALAHDLPASFAERLARVPQLQPPRGTGRRATRVPGARRPPMCSRCGCEGHRASWIACPLRPKRAAKGAP
jgi:hypothetical protein